VLVWNPPFPRRAPGSWETAGAVDGPQASPADHGRPSQARLPASPAAGQVPGDRSCYENGGAFESSPREIVRSFAVPLRWPIPTAGFAASRWRGLEGVTETVGQKAAGLARSLELCITTVVRLPLSRMSGQARPGNGTERKAGPVDDTPEAVSRGPYGHVLWPPIRGRYRDSRCSKPAGFKPHVKRTRPSPFGPGFKAGRPCGGSMSDLRALL